MAHHWPPNVRELERVGAEAVTPFECLEQDALPPAVVFIHTDALQPLQSLRAEHAGRP